MDLYIWIWFLYNRCIISYSHSTSAFFKISPLISTSSRAPNCGISRPLALLLPASHYTHTRNYVLSSKACAIIYISILSNQLNQLFLFQWLYGENMILAGPDQQILYRMMEARLTVNHSNYISKGLGPVGFVEGEYVSSMFAIIYQLNGNNSYQ